jgi:uncharacterized Zn-finger protein
MGDKPYKCDVCRKGFKEKDSLEKHKKAHDRKNAHDYKQTQDNCDKPFKCNICGKELSHAATAVDIQTHMKTHSEFSKFLNDCQEFGLV